MRKVSLGLFIASMLLCNRANAACTTFPTTLTNGSVADANQVMGNFNYLAGCTAPLASPSFTGSVDIGTTSGSSLINGYGNQNSGVMLSLTNASNGGSAYAGEMFFNDMNYWGRLRVVSSGANSGFGPAGSDTWMEASNNLWLMADGTHGIGFTTNSATRMFITSAGFVGIGTTTPSYMLYVNGTAYATGAAGALSDIRHKDNVKSLADGALAIVQQLRPVTFTWKEPKDDGMKGQQTGLIAQEVQKILPSTVLTENNDEKTLAIKYDELIPILIKAIQEQEAEIKTDRARILSLENEVSATRTAH